MEKILTLKWVLENEYIMENTDMGYVAVVTTAGGSFSGQINGIVEPAGSTTWVSTTEENSVLTFNLVLKEDNGGHIFTEGNLILNLDPKLEEKIVNGETLDKSEYYFKGTMAFHTGEEQLKFLERKLFIVEAEINQEGYGMEVYMP